MTTATERAALMERIKRSLSTNSPEFVSCEACRGANPFCPECGGVGEVLHPDENADPQELLRLALEALSSSAPVERPLPVWTMQEVAALNALQTSGRTHPYTCANRSDHPELWGDAGVLVATIHGWICPCCDYTQGWAHGVPPTPGPMCPDCGGSGTEPDEPPYDGAPSVAMTPCATCAGYGVVKAQPSPETPRCPTCGAIDAERVPVDRVEQSSPETPAKETR